MIRQNQKKINFIFALADVFIFIICAGAGYRIISARAEPGGRVSAEIPRTDFILYFISAAGSHIFFYFRFRFYKSHRTGRFRNEFYTISKACVSAFIFLLAFSFLLFKEQIIYELTAVSCALNYVILSAYKYGVRKSLKFLRGKGYNLKYLVIVGKNGCTESFAKKIEANGGFGYKIAGAFGDEKLGDIPMLGEIGRLDEYLRSSPVDEVIITVKDDAETLSRIADICNFHGAKFTVIPDIFSIFNGRFYMYEFDNILGVSAYRIPLENAANCALKRAFDIIFSIFSLALCSPLMIAVGILIKATSKGPVIYKQTRMGINKKEFVMYKFRSMREEAEPVYKMTERNDGRCTPVGAFIRKYSIDELPQIFNVLKGDMSWVGPRPERPYYAEKFREEIPLYMVKHYIKPGITGWAQVNGLRGNTPIEERIKHDIFYIENWSFLFDVKIILLTLSRGIFDKNAY